MLKVKALGGFDQLIIDNILKLMNDAGLIPMANDVDLQAIKYEPCFQNFKRFHKIRANCHQLAHGHPTPVAASMVFNYLSLAGTPCDPKPVSLGQFIEKIDIEILGEQLVQSADTHPQPLVKEAAVKGEAEVEYRTSLGITPAELRTHDKLIGFSYEVMDDLFMINREYGISEVGNPYQGAWVCRKFHTGEYVDHDRYRNDLFERLNVKGNQ